MKNTKADILRTVVLVVAIGVLGYFVFSSKKPEPINNFNYLSEKKDEAPVFEVKTKRLVENNSNLVYTIDIAYPEILGVDEAIANKINKDVVKRINNLATDFKENKDKPVDLGDDEKSSLVAEFSFNPPSHNILSLMFYVSEYLSGAAHPNTFALSLNYDMTTGDYVSLKSLFINKENYLKLLRDKVRPILEEKAGNNSSSKDWIFDGTEAEIENYSDFVIREDDLVLIFNPYQVGPYALGIVEASISISSLASDLDSKIITN